MKPLENLKGFASSRPPLMIFMLCLSAFAIILLSLAYVIKVNEIKNPDLSEDWNVFLGSFSNLEFCITASNETVHTTNLPPLTIVDNPPQQSLNEEMMMTGEKTNYIHNITADPYMEITRNYSVSLLISIYPTTEFLQIPHNITHLFGSLTGQQLGLRGPAAMEELNVTFALPYDWNTTQCDQSGRCDMVRIYTCVHFQAALSVFPLTRRPQSCQGLNQSGIEYHAHMEAHKDYSFLRYYRCRQQTKLFIHYELNPTLTVMLSVHDRSVINLHLIHTSYFLFVMVITMLCYAILRGRPAKPVLKYHHLPLTDVQDADLPLRSAHSLDERPMY